MSGQAIGWAFDHSEAKSTTFAVLLAMADWAGQDHKLYASYRRLARKARVSVSTVRRALRELEVLGEVKQVAPGDFGTASDRQSASDWVLAKIPCVQADHVFRVNTSCVQGEHSTILNVKENKSSMGANAPKLEIVNQSLNQPLSETTVKKGGAKRDNILGKGMTDEEWITHLSRRPEYARLNVRAKFSAMLAWCQKRNEQPTRKRLQVWLDKDAQDQVMVPVAPAPVRIVRDEFEEMKRELAAG